MRRLSREQKIQMKFKELQRRRQTSGLNISNDRLMEVAVRTVDHELEDSPRFDDKKHSKVGEG